MISHTHTHTCTFTFPSTNTSVQFSFGYQGLPMKLYKIFPVEHALRVWLNMCSVKHINYMYIHTYTHGLIDDDTSSYCVRVTVKYKHVMHL